MVVGAGAAGLAAATAARRRGASVTIIERRRLGGDCTWAGCVPSKALLDQARKVHGAREIGLDGPVDFATVMERVDRIVHEVATDEDRPTLEAQGIRVLEGQAAFTAPRTLSVDGTTVRGGAVILATGTTALVPPITGLAEAAPLTNDTVFDLRRLPARLAVMGGGPIGLELGQAFARLGSAVTILEGLPRVAPREEPEASAVLADVLRGEQIELVLGSFVEEVAAAGQGHELRTKDGRTVAADAILCAVGRQPVTDGLAFDRGGVEIDDRGFIKTNDKLETTGERTYAVGDIVGGLQFTHVGYDMGALAVGNALGRIARGWDARVVPWVTFTEPEIGRVGLTERQAHAEHGDAAKVAFLPIAETDRAKVTGAKAGFVKLVAGPHTLIRGLGGGRVLGATVVAQAGGEVVHEAALAMRANMITGRLAQTVHAYPTWSLALREAAAMFFFEHKGRKSRPARAS